METQIKELTLWNKNFILIICANFFVSLSFQVLIPTMPLYVIEIGLPEVLIGLIIGSLTFTTIVLRPFTGKAADLWNRKNFFVVGMFIIACSVSCYQFTDSLYQIIALRLVHGIGWGIVTTSSKTIAADFIPAQHIGEGMGYYGISTVFSTAVAPAMGIYLFDLFGFQAVFYSAAIFTLSGAVLALFIRYEKVELKVERDPTLSTKLFESKAFKPSTVNFFISLSFSSITTYIVLYATELNISNIGMFFTTFAITLLVIRPTSGRLIDKKGLSYLLTPGIIAVGAGILNLYFASSLYAVLLSAVLIGIGMGTIQPSLQAMAISKVSPERRGAASSTFMLSSDLGFGLGVMLWGVVANLTSYKLMYLSVLAPIVLAFSVHKFYITHRKLMHTDISEK